jgi:hypothetical protein
VIDRLFEKPFKNGHDTLATWLMTLA